jgi:nitroreductase
MQEKRTFRFLMMDNKELNMKDFKELVQLRRSHRKFTDEEVSSEDVKTIMRAALMSPSSKSTRGWQFIVVDDKIAIEKIADAKSNGAQFLKSAPLVVVIAGDPGKSDCWIEDCSIAATIIQLQVQDLGLGSCWAQMRGRGLDDGTTADDVIKGVLDIPAEMQVLCAIGIGHPEDERKPQNEDNLLWEQVHINKY